MAIRLDPGDKRWWDEHGWLRLAGVLDRGRRLALEAWVEEVGRWPATDGPGLHHFEQTERGAVIARSELFADDHEGLGEFVRHGLVPEVVGQLFDEPAALFKEKINYKHPGGGGFAPHQDASAYRFVDHHISVMVPIDAATEASGCLWFADGHRDGLMETDGRGRIVDAVACRLDWRPLEVLPGDVVLFDSYAPHRSETNTTDRPRRVLYLTYNAASKGDFRADYYRDKLDEFDREGQTFSDQRVRMSINDDFLGAPPASPEVPDTDGGR